MRAISPVLFASATLAVLLAGCSSGNSTTCGSNCVAPPAATVYLTMTDDPPAGVQVLSFQASVMAASLMPSSSSGTPAYLLNDISNFGGNAPPGADVTQLQALSAFFSTAQVPSGTYSSLSLSFGNLQLAIYNQSDSSLGSGCPVGSICELGPSNTNSTISPTVTFTSSPLPITLARNSLEGIQVDLHLNNLIQPDLSVDVNAANAVTIAALPATPAPAQLGVLTGTVLSAPAGVQGFTLQAPWGGTFNIVATGSTTFNDFPSSACTAPALSCVARGEIVEVGVSGMATNSYAGELTAGQVNYVQGATGQTVEGTISEIFPSTTNIAGAPPIGFAMILHSNPTNAAGFPLGGIADVSVGGSVSYSVDTEGLTVPAGLTFGSASNLIVGQNVKVTVQPGSLQTTGSGPNAPIGPPPSLSFAASAIALEPGQVTGTLEANNPSSSSAMFTLNSGGGLFFATWPIPNTSGFSFYLDTTGGTAYTGFSPDSLSGLASGDLVSVSGWLFAPPTAGGIPDLVAQSMAMRQSL